MYQKKMNFKRKFVKKLKKIVCNDENIYEIKKK